MDSKLTVDLLTSVLPHWLIEKHAEQLEVVERLHKVDPVVLVWTLVLGFPAGAKRTIASLIRRFEQVSCQEIARSSFYDRLTPAVARLMRRLVDWSLDMKSRQTNRQIGEPFEGFK